MKVEKVKTIGGGLVIEGFVSNQKEFELDLLWKRQPGEVL